MPELANILETAMALHHQGELAQAETLYRTMLERAPLHFDALHLLGVVEYQRQHYAAAAQLIGQALTINPRSAAAHWNLGLAWRDLKRHDEALASFERALTIEPGFVRVLFHRGNALFHLGREAEAIDSYRRALAIEPDFAEALNGLGIALKICGRIEEARQAFERAVALAPIQGRFHRTLAETKRFAPGDPLLAAMEQLARDMGSLPEPEQMELHFAIAKALDDVGRRATAFDHLIAGNALKRRAIAYDEPATLTLLARTQAVFSAEFMRDKAGLGDPSSVPVFIVGMPRSGTTLVEQILASHPAIFGAGEREDFSLLLTRDFREFADPASGMTGAALRRFGAAYLDAVGRDAAPGTARITDKMPEHFRFAGLIHLALPNARIIHVRRDPVDTCFSIFSKLFASALPYAYDLGELGRYYRAYERLMEHWRQVLPPDVMIEVTYEELIADLEGQARRMIGHCGLAWHEACLAFHRTERPIRTASNYQARQPIDARSIGRGHAYGALLDPLREVLETGR